MVMLVGDFVGLWSLCKCAYCVASDVGTVDLVRMEFSCLQTTKLLWRLAEEKRLFFVPFAIMRIPYSL